MIVSSCWGEHLKISEKNHLLKTHWKVIDVQKKIQAPKTNTAKALRKTKRLKQTSAVVISGAAANRITNSTVWKCRTHKCLQGTQQTSLVEESNHTTTGNQYCWQETPAKHTFSHVFFMNEKLVSQTSHLGVK